MTENSSAAGGPLIIDLTADVPHLDGAPFDGHSNDPEHVVFEAVKRTHPWEAFPVRLTLRTRSGVGDYLLTSGGELVPVEPSEVDDERSLEVVLRYQDNTQPLPALSAYPEAPGYPGSGGYPGAGGYPEARLPAHLLGPEPMTRAQAKRASFLAQRPEAQRAREGWRGFLAGFGLQIPPSRAELDDRAAMEQISRNWSGPRTIAVVNGKGGAGKTPTTLMLAAAFARFGGVGVLAWDNNQTRGTLGWRTERDDHDATLLDLLPEAEALLGRDARFGDLARFVHHQKHDRFDVLRSQPMALAQQQRLFRHDVDAVHAVATKYYRVIVMDSGNDESDPMWRRMIELVDQVVVATTTRDDHAEAGALLLEALATGDDHARHLADTATVVVSRADPRASRADVDRIVHGYRTLAREVATIPHDPAMVEGVLRYSDLRRSTQRAWLRAAAAVASGL